MVSVRGTDLGAAQWRVGRAIIAPISQTSTEVRLQMPARDSGIALCEHRRLVHRIHHRRGRQLLFQNRRSNPCDSLRCSARAAGQHHRSVGQRLADSRRGSREGRRPRCRRPGRLSRARTRRIMRALACFRHHRRDWSGSGELLPHVCRWDIHRDGTSADGNLERCCDAHQSGWSLQAAGGPALKPPVLPTRSSRAHRRRSAPAPSSTAPDRPTLPAPLPSGANLPVSRPSPRSR